MTNQQKRQVFHTLFMVVFAVTLGFSVVNPFFPVYMKTLTGHGLIIALVFSGFFLAKMIFTPFLCRWSDFAGRRIFILCGLALHTLIAFVFFLLPENIIFIVVLRFFQGVATAMVRPIAQAFVGDISPENHEGTSMGTFDVAFYIALSVGPILGGAIGDNIGYRGMFGVLLILCFTALLIALTTMTREKQIPVKENITLSLSKDIFDNPPLQGLLTFIFARSFGIVILPIFLPLFLLTRFHASHLEIGICLAACSITTALLLPGMGQLSDRGNRKTLVAVGGMMSGLFTLALPLAQNYWQAMALCILLSFSSALSIPASTAMLVEEGRRHGLGYTMGLFHTTMNIGFFIGPLLAGLLMDTLGMNSLFQTAGLLGIAGALLFALRLARKPWEQNHNDHPGKIMESSHPDKHFLTDIRQHN